MIEIAVTNWYNHKEELRKYFETTPQSEYSDYIDLFKLVCKYIFNAKDNSMHLNIEAITIVNDGDYQGTFLYIIPESSYQPCIHNYYWDSVEYGSCSGCDALLAVSGYSSGIPTKKQVNGYMNLCLHLVQRLKPLISRESANELWDLESKIKAEDI